jgi:hypothetical protein
MRTYSTDSPEAAARVVALALLADGDLSRVELARLDDLGAHEMLGLTRAELHGVLNDFCYDLLETTRLTWGDACRVDPLTLSQLLAEVQSPPLRSRVLSLCLAVAEADEVVTDGESLVLVSAVEQWGLQGEMLMRPAPA